MIHYRRCSEVDQVLVYQAFKEGFSDYVIKLDISKDMFLKRFFGPEGNSLSNSFLALDGVHPIGLVLGGVKNYEGIMTMRCGSFAVVPWYRGKGISQQLFKFHRLEAIKLSCKQLFLEVLVGNDRAVNFYKSLGYEKIYDLGYFSRNDIDKLSSKPIHSNIDFRLITIEDIRKTRVFIKDIHINWQNDIEAIELSEDQLHYGAFLKGQLVGVISINKNTRINFIWVQNTFRCNGIGKTLLLHASKELGLSRASISFPNNSSLEGFLKKLGFKRDALSQYEMYYTL